MWGAWTVFWIRKIVEGYSWLKMFVWKTIQKSGRIYTPGPLILKLNKNVGTAKPILVSPLTFFPLYSSVTSNLFLSLQIGFSFSLCPFFFLLLPRTSSVLYFLSIFLSVFPSLKSLFVFLATSHVLSFLSLKCHNIMLS